MSDKLKSLMEKSAAVQEEVDLDKVAEDVYVQGRILGRGIVDEINGVDKTAGAEAFLARLNGEKEIEKEAGPIAAGIKSGAKNLYQKGTRLAAGVKNEGEGMVSHRSDRIGSGLANLGVKVKGMANKGLSKVTGGKAGKTGIGAGTGGSFKSQRNIGAAAVTTGLAGLGAAGYGVKKAID